MKLLLPSPASRRRHAAQEAHPPPLQGVWGSEQVRSLLPSALAERSGLDSRLVLSALMHPDPISGLGPSGLVPFSTQATSVNAQTPNGAPAINGCERG